MHNPVIYKEIGINIIFPTTSVCDHSSFPKEEIQDRIDFLVPQMEILLFDSFFIRKKQTGNNLFFRIDPKTHTSSHASTSHIPAPPHTPPHTSSHASTPHIPRTSSHRSTPPARSPGLLFSPSSERPQRSVKKGRLFERSEFLPFSVVQEASRRKK
jgi:hypothetical protein